jgi:hypothetical protein
MSNLNFSPKDILKAAQKDLGFRVKEFSEKYGVVFTTMDSYLYKETNIPSKLLLEILCDTGLLNIKDTKDFIKGENE